MDNNHFKIDWVLQNELAVGPAPISDAHIDELKKEKIFSILSLCSKTETVYLDDIDKNFNCRRVILPDHKYKKPPTVQQINNALDVLAELILLGPVFVHCVASVERSPLVCIAWLIRKHNLNIQQALDYMMQVHVGTNPLPIQLNLLEEL